MFLVVCGSVLLTAILVYLYKFVFEEPSLRKYEYPFKEPGISYRLSYLLYRIILPAVFWRRKRFNVHTSFGKNAIEIGMLPRDEHVKLEYKQKDSQTKMDELKISGFEMKTGSMLDLTISNNKSSETGRYWLHLVLKSDSETRHYTLPNVQQTIFRQIDKENQCNLWQADDLKISCLQPLRRWRILFNGFLRDTQSGKIDHVKFTFLWNPFSSTMDHTECATNSVLADALAKSSDVFPISTISSIVNQYDQWGVLHGTCSINDGQEKEILLRGTKTRHIGDFSWLDVHRSVDIKLYLEDGTAVSINMISLKTGSLPELIWGYIELCGNTTNKVKNTDFIFPTIQNFKQFPSLFSIRLHTDGEEFIITLVNESEPQTNIWGPSKWSCIDISMTKVKVSMTNVTQNFIQNGHGVVHFGVAREIPSMEDSISSETVLKPVLIKDVKKRNQVVLEFTDRACCDSTLTGGKGSSLAMLTSVSNEKFVVPPGFCVTISAYQKHIENHSEIQNAIQNVTDVCCGKKLGTIQEATDKLVGLFLDSKISEELRTTIADTLSKLCGSSIVSERFAVRSSAAGEDGEEMSGAGQMETFLGCKGLEQICESVVKCWASLYGLRAVQYRRQNGQIIDVGMAVVIQKMVAADVAGVLFTRHPRTGNPGIMTISANSGLGESVVSATCDPDAINIKRTHNDEVSLGDVSLGKKEVKIVMTDSGVETVKNSEDDVNKACITEKQALQLSSTGIYVERCYGDPRDIEWAFCNQKLYLLQSRPITSLDIMSEFEQINEFNTPLMTDLDEITGGNIKEVMPGALSPMYNSFGRVLAAAGFDKCPLMAKSKKTNPLCKRALNIYKWHMFFNRTETTFSINKRHMTTEDIQMRNGFDIAINGRVMEPDIIGVQRNRYSSRYVLWQNNLRFIMCIMTAKRMIRKMKKMFENFELNFDNCQTSEQLATKLFNEVQPFIEAFDQHVSISVASMIMNSMVFIDLLKSTEVTAEHYGDFAKLMSIDSHSDQVESADVPTALKDVAQAIKAAISKEQFCAMTKEEAVQWLNSDESPVKSVYQSFISKHGHRCFKEFDFCSNTWNMDQTQLIDPLKASVNDSTSTSTAKLSVDQTLEQLKTKLSPKEKKSLGKRVLTAREYVAYREQAKSLLIRTIHQYRKQLVRLGEIMVKEGRIPDPKLVMFMTYYEVFDLIATRSSVIVQRAVRRKKLQPQLERKKYPEICYGYPQEIKPQVSLSSDGSVVMKGTPVSNGTVEAPARVVTYITEAGSIQPGDILVTEATDIAWSPYFPSLAGVITELGGLISHGAVVAREYGIPCVVGVTGATDMLKSGDFIRLNGNTGKIEKLKTEEQS